jgi:integron integrase
MHKSFTESEIELGRFGEFLLKRRIVPEKHAPYYVSWVRRFLTQVPDRPGLALPDRVGVFVDNLRDRVEPWQLTQAERAVRLYFTNYLNEGGTASAAPTFAPDAAGFIRKADACDGVRQLIRLRHYSIRTEHTYLHWIGRFFLYLATQESGSSGESVRITPQAVRDYLAALAVKDRVSASTQNQAFSALLFLCREVLRIDLGDLSQAVRARRGRRLPVVLSVAELQALLANINGTPRLMAELIYGGGLRVNECCKLRVKDIDADAHLLYVRDGKGGKDRTTLLPRATVPALNAHLHRVRQLHEKDLAEGHGEVAMPDALDRKYPNAGREWCWQYVFPSRTLSVDPRSGKVRRWHVSDTANP